MDMNGLCSAHLMTDRTSGRCMVITAWQDRDTLAASRAATARLRTDAAEAAHLQIRCVEEYQLVFSSVRDGDTRSLSSATSNCGTPGTARAGWAARTCTGSRPGAGRMQLTGREAAERSGASGTRHSLTTGSR